MSFSVQYPSMALSPFIKQYWALDGNIDKGTEHLQRIVPTGLAEMIFYFNDLPVNTVRGNTRESRSVINGQQSEFYELKISGRINLLSVSFTPQGTKQFFNIPISEIQNKNLPLRFLAGAIADELEEKLYHKPDFKSRVALLEKYLIKKLGERTAYNFKRISHTVRAIARSGGNTDVKSLASSACLSTKQFERVFTGNIGLSPKQYLRVIRFQKAIRTRQLNPGYSLTEIAYNSGFSDQSHMIREFISISGLTPGKYFASCDPVSDFYS
ncbi:MAG: helix-turn-helix domain-containing protein [Eudoraea sp.]|nr:helix-turn-helix domain-containing protein [Eudoraea sp.]